MDSSEIHFNADDLRGERAAAIALYFTNAKAPVPTSAINDRFYADLSEDNRRKTFSRDRGLLADIGFLVREAGSRPLPGGGTEKLWEADEEANFAHGVELGALEAVALDVACQPLLEDPGFMLGGALRRALAKIDRTYGNAEQAIETNAPQVDAVATTLQGCIEEGVAAKLRYRDAEGRESERLFAPLGTFSLREHAYAVGDMVLEGNARRVLRLDRIQSIERTDRRHDAPAGFDVNDYRKLPFQIGETLLEGVFLVPEDRAGYLRRESLGKGSFTREPSVDGGSGPLTWRVDVSSIDDAACWAVAHGIRPLEPESLAEAWARCLEGVIEHG